MPQDIFVWKYESYGKMLFRLAMTHLGNSADAEDVMQEAFYRLLFRAPSFVDGEHEKRWLIRIAVNLCKDKLKSGWRKKTDLTDAVVQFAQNPEDREIAELLLNLPEKYRTSIHLHYTEGYSVAEIARILHVSESAVKMRLLRGRNLLKLEWEE